VLGCVSDIAGKDVVVASFATDGIDGNSDCAGALADGCSLARAEMKKLDPCRFLEENNSSVFFKGLGDVLCTGRTGTNVMDIQILIL
jgi:glycerate 2-kinase